MILLFVLASCAAEFYRVDLVLLLAWLVGRLIEAALWSLCFDGEVSSGLMIFTRYDFVIFATALPPLKSLTNTMGLKLLLRFTSFFVLKSLSDLKI